MATQEFTWLTILLENLYQPSEEPMSLHCDSLSAIKLAENPVFLARTKHIEVHYHYIWEKVLQEELALMPIGTKDQVADIFTKELNSNAVFKHREALNMGWRSKIKKNQCWGGELLGNFGPRVPLSPPLSTAKVTVVRKEPHHQQHPSLFFEPAYSTVIKWDTSVVHLPMQAKRQ